MTVPAPRGGGRAVGVDLGRQVMKTVVRADGPSHTDLGTWATVDRSAVTPHDPAIGGWAVAVQVIAEAARFTGTASGEDRALVGPCQVVLAVPSEPPGVGGLDGTGAPDLPGIRERAQHLTADLLAAGVTVQVSHADAAVCVAACLPAGDAAPAGLIAVCDVGARSLTAALCVHDDAGLRLVDVETDHETTATAVRALEHAVARAAGPAVPGRPVTGTPSTDVVHELHRNARRARILLDGIVTDQTFRQAPVYFPGLASAPTAAEVEQLLSPLGTAAAGALNRLLARQPAPSTDAVLVLAGGYGTMAPVRTAVTAAAAAAGVRRCHEGGPYAAARGAARLAAGAVRLQTASYRSLRLQGRRLRAGRLESVAVDLALAGRPLADPVCVGDVPVAVTIDVADAGMPLPIQVGDPFGRWYDLPVAVSFPAPPGTYRVGMRPGRSPLGNVVLYPGGGGYGITVPLPLLPADMRPDEAAS